MRASPSLQSEIVSQSFFSEKVFFEDILDSWVKIKTPDGYLGWAEKSSFLPEKEYHPSVKVASVFAHFYEEKKIEYGPCMTLPFASSLELKEIEGAWASVIFPSGKMVYTHTGNLALGLDPIRKKDLIALGKKFLHIPYTWGGRSSFGFDCSGFIQMLYREMGILLPRDAKDQRKDSQLKIISQEKLFPGDLIFWGKSDQEICHVGMFMEGDFFLHSSAKENLPHVRVSSFLDPIWRSDADSPYPYRCFATVK